MTLFTTALVLFFIMDPMGNISTFLKILEPFDARRRNLIIFREMLIVLAIMLFFSFFGEFFITFLQISETTVRLSSGVILFLIALTIIFPGMRNVRASLPKVEPFIIPLAVPLIAGPALIATIMLFAHLQPRPSTMIAAIFISWFCALVILLFATQLKNLLRNNGLIAFEKLMGMILILISVQRFMDGVHSFFVHYNG